LTTGVLLGSITPRHFVEKLNSFIIEHENRRWNELAGRLLRPPDVSPAICLFPGCSSPVVVFPFCPDCCRSKYKLEVRPSTLGAGLGLFACAVFNAGDYVCDYRYDIVPDGSGIVRSVSF
jgi:hypothetical protein